ncbi:MAG: NAD(P)/FAD-dependent oxidoreductase [Treponema sp.]|nr:NAD(P)/FAD-dependent oxidoreductase [Treponema sp.]
MSRLRRINNKLRTHFDGRVWAVLDDECLVLEGSLDSWADVVEAGFLAVKGLRFRCKDGIRRGRFRGFVNRVRFTGGEIPPMRVPEARDAGLEGEKPDVLVIGGGITGCAVARELSRYDLDILLVEKEHDVAMHASSRNDGMVHPGLDLFKGTQKYHYNRLGGRMYGGITRDLGVPFERTGQYLCFNGIFAKPLLYLSLLYWKWLGIPGVKVIGKKELHDREPGLGADLTAALFFPGAGVVCPYNLTIAYAENAVQNGARISLDTAVTGMRTEGGRIVSVTTNRGTVYPSVTVNAAGVFADEVAAMAGDRFYSIHPRRGINSILDKKMTGVLLNTIASRINLFSKTGAASGGAKKTGHSKGGGMIRTAHGNILVGPDAEEVFDREDYATNRESVNRVFAKFRETVPALSLTQIITSFAGIRAPTYEEDFVVCKGRRTANLVHAAGIQSPGLTAAPAIAVDAARFAAEILEAGGKRPAVRPDFNPIRKPIPHAAALSDAEREALIRANPDYGVILCRCEEVSRGEILDALRRPVPCDTLDGVRRRVRPGSGRCQGAFCGPLILELIAGEKSLPFEKVLKNGPGGTVLCGPVKAARYE